MYLNDLSLATLYRIKRSSQLYINQDHFFINESINT